MLSNDDNSMAISTDAKTGKQWWMWFGGNSGNDPANYDFVLNGGGQVYAKDFICTNSKHSYNICEQISKLWAAIDSGSGCSSDNCGGYGCDDDDCPGYGGSGCGPEHSECVPEGGGYDPPDDPDDPDDPDVPCTSF